MWSVVLSLSAVKTARSPLQTLHQTTFVSLCGPLLARQAIRSVSCTCQAAHLLSLICKHLHPLARSQTHSDSRRNMAWLRAPPSGGRRSANVPASCVEVEDGPTRRLRRRRTLPADRPPDNLAAEHLLDGSHLLHFADRCVYLAIERLGRPASSRQLRVASV